MFARIVTMTFDDGRSLSELRAWVDARLPDTRTTPGLVTTYWMVNRWDAKVAFAGIYESEEALRATDERSTQARAELHERWAPSSTTVEEFQIIAQT